MNCVEYIENFLSAHADGELTPAELREAEAHLRECLKCSARLEEELALKTLLRGRIRMRTAPAEVRTQLLAALDRAAAEEEATREGRRRPSADRPGGRTWKRAALWIPLVIAASLVIFFATRKELSRERLLPLSTTATARNPQFDIAISALKRFQHHFQPNVPSASPADIRQAYARARLPDFLWTFAQTGLTLEGGRIERLPDGRKVAYTFYRGAQGTLLCTRFKAAENALPKGHVEVLDGHYFYRYRGYSLCYTRVGRSGFICILASRLPLDQMITAVKLALK